MYGSRPTAPPLFAPIAAVLVSRLGLEPAVRILLVNAAVVMTAKTIWLYLWSTETRQGRVRMEQTRHESVVQLLRGYRHALALLGRSPGSRLALIIAGLVAAVTLIEGTFWQVVINQRLQVPDPALPFFPMVRSLLSVVFLFTLIPRLSTGVDLKRGTLWGFGVYLAGQLVLVAIPATHGGATAGTYAALGLCVLLDSFGAGILFMLSESLVALHVDEAERSRVMALQRTVIMLAAAPFGWISGWLSSLDRSYPFWLTAALLLAGLALVATRWVPVHAGDHEHALAEVI